MNIERSVQSIAEALSRVDDIPQWELVRARYTDVSRILHNNHRPYIPDNLRDRISVAMLPLSARYKDREEDLVNHTLATFGNIDKHEIFGPEMVAELYLGGPSYNSVRAERGDLPPPVQVIVETIRRERDMNELNRILADLRCSVIAGGSLVYAPYYDVRGSVPAAPSDLDILLVVPDWEYVILVADRICRVHGVDELSAERFGLRAQHFLNQFSGPNAMFSHKVLMWTKEIDPIMTWIPTNPAYPISVHILSVEAFHYLLAESSDKLRRERSGEVRTLWDYRESRPNPCERRLNFAGKEEPVDATVEEADSNFRCRTPIYYVDDIDRYYPGLIQNLILPSPGPSFDRLGVRPAFERFLRKIAERLAHERRRWPDEDLRGSHAHPRHQRFAPHVRERLDRQLDAGG